MIFRDSQSKISKLCVASSSRALVLVIALHAQVVWLKPIEDLFRHLVLDVLACHARLVYEELADEDLSEGMTDELILLGCRRRMVTEVDLRAARRLALFAWCLIAVTAIEAEHQLVRHFVEEGHIHEEFGIIALEGCRELDLNQLIEFFGALPPV